MEPPEQELIRGKAVPVHYELFFFGAHSPLNHLNAIPNTGRLLIILFVNAIAEFFPKPRELSAEGHLRFRHTHADGILFGYRILKEY
jgi:hypothetical protein